MLTFTDCFHIAHGLSLATHLYTCFFGKIPQVSANGNVKLYFQLLFGNCHICAFRACGAQKSGVILGSCHLRLLFELSHNLSNVLILLHQAGYTHLRNQKSISVL